MDNIAAFGRLLPVPEGNSAGFERLRSVIPAIRGREPIKLGRN